MGNINLDLYAPLIIKTKTDMGCVDVDGMLSKGSGFYTVPDKTPIETLELRSNMGNITVKYHG